MIKHQFTPWSGIRSSGLLKATVKMGESHATCTICGVTAKKAVSGRISYWDTKVTPHGTAATWVSKSPPCKEP